VLAALDTGRSGLSGSLRRGADATLVRTLDRQGKFEWAARALEPLARTENEPWMWQYLATLQYKSGRYEEASQRLEAALKKDPQNPQWRELKSLAELHQGRYREAAKTLEALQRDHVQGVDVRNNLVWARLLAGPIDDELERDALRLAEAGEASEAALHTAAMVLLERGRVLDAAEFGEKRLARLGGKPDDGQWLLRGRLGQVLGLSEVSRAAYAKVSSKRDPELGVLVKRFLSEKVHGVAP
jgi:tetratricopeptide (TPR) repeat protein